MKKAVFLGLMLAFLAGSGLASAATNIDNCTDISSPGDYVLTANITSSEALGVCIDISTSNISFDCTGHAIDTSVSNIGIKIYNESVPYLENITIENCIITDFGNNAIYSEFALNLNIHNNTLINDYDAVYFPNTNNSVIFNNTILDSEDIGIYSSISSFNNISFNFLNNNCFAIEEERNVEANYVYNNFLNSTCNNVDWTGTSVTQIWNKTRQSGTRIYSAGTEIGGNYWVSYSDTCTDANTDGFCDDPYDVEAGVACAEVTDGLPACGNNTDWLPLSALYEPPCVQNWTCTEWGECVRGYQNRECTDENQCDNETGRPAERQLCLTPVPNATMNITQACCPISTLRCFDNSTLVEIWNTSAGVAYAFEDCPFGCDNSTLSCAPKKFEQNLYLLGIFIFIVVAGLIAIKWAKR